MNWSDKWRELVLRSSFRKGRSPFAIGEFVEWYGLQLEHNNYPGVLLGKVQRHLGKHSTVLDIGAGTGAFALPLARRWVRRSLWPPICSMAFLTLRPS
jgi:2-polyprenyl-3-methyl-5-hydroxy-6-metoxy-1,4-benzoquinol methylase